MPLLLIPLIAGGVGFWVGSQLNKTLFWGAILGGGYLLYVNRNKLLKGG